jgi:hypothetical protein
MFQLDKALALCIAVAIVSGGLACSSQSAKSGGDGAQASSSPSPGAADTPSSPGATTPPPAGKEPAQPADALPGGKIDILVKDPGVIEAANFACTAEQDGLKAQGQPQAITLVDITAAQSQVVEGVSYSLTLHVKVDGQDQTADAVVWVRAWLKGDDKFKLTPWKFVDKK